MPCVFLIVHSLYKLYLYAMSLRVKLTSSLTFLAPGVYPQENELGSRLFLRITLIMQVDSYHISASLI